MTVRLIALDLLREALRGSRRSGLREALDSAIRRYRLEGPDAGLLTELVYGAVRHAGSLDAVIAAFSRAPLRRLDENVRAALRLGLYQMVCLDRVPNSAAVNETVEALKRRTNKRAAGFANAVLRAAGRAFAGRREGELDDAERRRAVCVRPGVFAVFDAELLPSPDEAQDKWMAGMYSLPRWLAARWLAARGPAEAERMAAAALDSPALYLRANVLRTSREALLARLRRAGVAAEEAEPPEGLRLPGRAAFRLARPLLDEGLCSVQDETAMRIAPMLSPEPGEVVADLCAGPGGKAAHLAELTGDRAAVLAVDVDWRSAQRVAENARRLGLKSVACVQADAGRLPLSRRTPKVLVDAPFNNPGVLARRPDARWRLRPSDIERLAALQDRILDAAADSLQSGGVLVYSTCSVEAEEDADAVRRFLRRRPEFALAREEEFLPHLAAGDGGYAAVLRRL